jgi:hypothetical protein
MDVAANDGPNIRWVEILRSPARHSTGVLDEIRRPLGLPDLAAPPSVEL